MHHPETVSDDGAVSDEAAAWYARLTADDATDTDRAAFVAWRESAPAHDADYRRLLKALSAADAALADISAPADVFEEESMSGLLVFRPPSSRRRPFVSRAAKALAAGIVIAAMAGLSFAVLDRPAYVQTATAVGEVREERLPDGSIVHLNARTRLSFAVDDGTRRVVLEDGEAFFRVAPDPARPFIVSAGTREVRVVGTAFNIRHINTRTEVAVAEGIVNLTREVGMLASFFPPNTSQRLTAGMAASYAAHADVVVTTNVSAATMAPWRRGQLIYRGARLEDVIADLDRHFAESLVVRGRDTANLKVSAVINLGDADTVLAALARQLPIVVRRTASGVTEIAMEPQR